MKHKIAIISGIVILILLDFAALDDITTGIESDFTLEFFMLLVSLPFLFLLGRAYVARPD